MAAIRAKYLPGLAPWVHTFDCDFYEVADTS
jgi:hypothetical protein